MSARANLRSEISLDDTKFEAGMRRVKSTASQGTAAIKRRFSDAGRAISRMGKSLGRAAGRFAKMGAGLAAIAIPAAAIAASYKLARGLKSAADAGGRLSDLASRTGIAAGELAVLEQAFKDNGIAMEKVGPIINKMQKGITDFGNGLSTQKRAFEALGISFQQISALDPAEQFRLLQKEITAIEDPTRRAGIAMDIFGRSGGELQALFDDQGALSKAAATIGGQAEILNKNAGKFDRISDLLASAGDKFQGFFVGALDKVADPLLEMLEAWNATDFAAIGAELGEKLGPFFERAKEFGAELKDSIESKGLQETLNKMAEGMADALVAAIINLSPKFLDIFTRIMNAVIEGLTGELMDAVGVGKNTRIGRAFEEGNSGNALTKPFRQAKAFLTDPNSADEQTMAEMKARAAATRNARGVTLAQLKQNAPQRVQQTMESNTESTAAMVEQQAETNLLLREALAE